MVLIFVVLRDLWKICNFVCVFSYIESRTATQGPSEITANYEWREDETGSGMWRPGKSETAAMSHTGTAISWTQQDMSHMLRYVPPSISTNEGTN